MKSIIDSDIWEAKKLLITRLYKDEEWPLKQVIKLIHTSEFHPSESQLRSRLKKWQITKPSRKKYDGSRRLSASRRSRAESIQRPTDSFRFVFSSPHTYNTAQIQLTAASVSKPTYAAAAAEIPHENLTTPSIPHTPIPRSPISNISYPLSPGNADRQPGPVVASSIPYGSAHTAAPLTPVTSNLYQIQDSRGEESEISDTNLFYANNCNSNPLESVGPSLEATFFPLTGCQGLFQETAPEQLAEYSRPEYLELKVDCDFGVESFSYNDQFTLVKQTTMDTSDTVSGLHPQLPPPLDSGVSHHEYDPGWISGHGLIDFPATYQNTHSV